MGAASPSSVAVGALRLASHKHRTLVVLWLARGDDRDTAGSGLVRCAYPEEVCREAKGNGALRLRLTLTCAVGGSSALE